MKLDDSDSLFFFFISVYVSLVLFSLFSIAGDAMNSDGGMDEEGGEFINLDDPNLEILDDTANSDAQEKSESDEDRHEGDEQDQAAEDEDGADVKEAEDLNAAPDHEPLSDDAVCTFKDPKGNPFHAIAVHPHKPLLAVSGESEVAYILEVGEDASTTTLLATLTGHSDTVSLLSFSPNGEWLATGSLDCTVIIWSTATWKQAHQLSDLCGEIMALLWHPSSLLLVASSDDAQAAMWNVLKGTVVMFFAGHRDAVSVLAWTADVKKLVSGSNDGSVSLFNPKTGVQELCLSKDLSPDNAGVTALSIIGEDQCLVGCEDGSLHVLSFRSGKVVMHLDEVHEQAIESIQSNKALGLIVTSGCDCKVAVWNASDFSLRTIFDATESVVPCMWSGSFIVAGCSDGQVRTWDGRSANLEPHQVFHGHRRMIMALACVNGFVATASDDGTTKLFRIQ